MRAHISNAGAKIGDGKLAATALGSHPPLAPGNYPD
jgi:hypothetical protein